jgi:hypothetical protein
MEEPASVSWQRTRRPERSDPRLHTSLQTRRHYRHLIVWQSTPRPIRFSTGAKISRHPRSNHLENRCLIGGPFYSCYHNISVPDLSWLTSMQNPRPSCRDGGSRFPAQCGAALGLDPEAPASASRRGPAPLTLPTTPYTRYSMGLARSKRRPGAASCAAHTYHRERAGSIFARILPLALGPRGGVRRESGQEQAVPALQRALKAHGLGGPAVTGPHFRPGAESCATRRPATPHCCYGYVGRCCCGRRTGRCSDCCSTPRHATPGRHRPVPAQVGVR